METVCKLSLLIALLYGYSASAAPASVTFTSEEDRLSYAIGIRLGEQGKERLKSLNLDILIQGMRDAIFDRPRALTEAETQATLERHQPPHLREQMKKVQEQTKDMEKNKAAAVAFLEKNKQNPGVQVTPSGLQYRILKEGAGKPPQLTDTVTVHYRGHLIDGTEFDSSYKRNNPATFPVNGVIPGWTEALQLMKPGATWTLYIPPELAYGTHGAGQAIGSNSLLIFDVELIAVGSPASKDKPAK